MTNGFHKRTSDPASAPRNAKKPSVKKTLAREPASGGPGDGARARAAEGTPLSLS